MNAVDCILDINNRYVLLVKRKSEPYKSYWALPGGRQEPFESLTKALQRVLATRLNLKADINDKSFPHTAEIKGVSGKTKLYQICTYDSGKDPRGGNTTVFAIQLNADKEKLELLLTPGEQVEEIILCDKNKLPRMAFDHERFIQEYFTHLKPYEETAETYDPSKYEKPSVTVDIVIFSVQDEVLKVLLVKRKVWPFKDKWALPGGFVQMEEGLGEAAKRELEEETGVKDVYLEQLYSFGEPKRDPRTRVITVAYFALIKAEGIKLKASTDVSEAGWFAVDDIPPLAFDHNHIFNYALQRLKWKLEYTTAAFSLLPKQFTLTQLQKVYEAVFGEQLDKRNFRKKLLSLNLLKEESLMEGKAHRPPRLYSFKGKLGEIVKFF